MQFAIPDYRPGIRASSFLLFLVVLLSTIVLIPPCSRTASAQIFNTRPGHHQHSFQHPPVHVHQHCNHPACKHQHQQHPRREGDGTKRNLGPIRMGPFGALTEWFGEEGPTEEEEEAERTRQLSNRYTYGQDNPETDWT